MKFFTILQTTPAADSLNSVQQELAEVAKLITTTPTNELLSDLLDKTVSFGLKLLAAFVIYSVGAWLIKKIKLMLTRIFERKKTDPAIASFSQSIASIALTLLLIIITVGTLGIEDLAIFVRLIIIKIHIKLCFAIWADYI